MKTFVDLGPDKNVLDKMWHVELIVAWKHDTGGERPDRVLQPAQRLCGSPCGRWPCCALAAHPAAILVSELASGGESLAAFES